MTRIHFSPYASHFFAALLLCSLFAGCSDSAPGARPDLPDPNAPPPPTPEEIASQIIADAQLDAPVPSKGSSLPPAVRQNILDLLRRANMNYSGTEDGKRALAIVSRKIDERVNTYERAQLWEHVLTYTDAHLIFNKGSKRFNHIRDRAIVELQKPRVTVRGLPEADGQQIAMLSIYMPMTSETYFERLAIGEEMHGIKVLNVFGEDRGVRLEYLKTGERYIAYLPAAE